jgi:hypothetical protein
MCRALASRSPSIPIYRPAYEVQIPAEPSVAEQLEGRLPQSQFERFVAELGSRVIPAQLPEAKGYPRGALSDCLARSRIG